MATHLRTTTIGIQRANTPRHANICRLRRRNAIPFGHREAASCDSETLPAIGSRRSRAAAADAGRPLAHQSKNPAVPADGADAALAGTARFDTRSRAGPTGNGVVPEPPEGDSHPVRRGLQSTATVESFPARLPFFRRATGGDGRPGRVAARQRSRPRLRPPAG